MVIDPYPKPDIDYHFYRQDMPTPEGHLWSHKQGKGKIKNYDSSLNPITDPLNADRNYSKEEEVILDKKNPPINSMNIIDKKKKKRSKASERDGWRRSSSSLFARAAVRW